MKRLALAATGMLVAASVVGLTGGTAQAGEPCGYRGPSNLENSHHTSTGQWAMYNGSSTTCSVISDIDTGDSLIYYCWTENLSSERSWTYLHDASTGVSGWVRDDHLPGNGAYTWCGF